MLKLLRGCLAGAVATGTMSAVMFAGKAACMLRTPPPEEITRRAGRKSGVEPEQAPREAFDVAWLASHLAFGSGCGGMFAIGRGALPRNKPAAGLVYGSLLWLASYVGVMPALGLYPWPSEDSKSRAAVMIAAHEVYGATLAALMPEP